MQVKISLLQDKLVIVKISGELTVFDDEFDMFSKELMAYTKMGIYRFIIDLDDLTYVDSSGVGLIIRLATNAMKKDTQICLMCSPPSVMKVLKVASVDKIINQIESREQGIAYYEQSTGFVMKN